MTPSYRIPDLHLVSTLVHHPVPNTYVIITLLSFPPSLPPSLLDKLKNEAVLDRINHKLNYIRNPRNDPDTVKDVLVRSLKPGQNRKPTRHVLFLVSIHLPSDTSL